CRSWEERGDCRYGNKCQFAHGPHELRPIERHAKVTSVPDQAFVLIFLSTCPYAKRCCFIH
ncbi:hypothetical protein IE81DRAFT_279053, partial [Ceraceosorus guamensis]